MGRELNFCACLGNRHSLVISMRYLSFFRKFLALVRSTAGEDTTVLDRLSAAVDELETWHRNHPDAGPSFKTQEPASGVFVPTADGRIRFHTDEEHSEWRKIWEKLEQEVTAALRQLEIFNPLRYVLSYLKKAHPSDSALTAATDRLQESLSYSMSLYQLTGKEQIEVIDALQVLADHRKNALAPPPVPIAVPIINAKQAAETTLATLLAQVKAYDAKIMEKIKHTSDIGCNSIRLDELTFIEETANNFWTCFKQVYRERGYEFQEFGRSLILSWSHVGR